MYLTMTIQMLGQLERKNRVLLISQSQLLQHSVSFVWQHHFRIDAFYISHVSDLAGILFIINHKISTTIFFPHVCQDCAVQTNSGRLAVSENSVLDRRRKVVAHNWKKIYYS